MTINIPIGYWIIPMIFTIVGIILLCIGGSKNKVKALDGIMHELCGFAIIMLSWLAYFMAHFFFGFKC